MYLFYNFFNKAMVNYNVSEIQVSEGYDIYPTDLSQLGLN